MPAAVSLFSFHFSAHLREKDFFWWIQTNLTMWIWLLILHAYWCVAITFHCRSFFYVRHENWVDKEWQRVRVAMEAQSKTYNKILFICLMAQFAIWILIFSSPFLSFALSIYLSVYLSLYVMYRACASKLMCWVEEECSPHLFDVCVYVAVTLVFRFQHLAKSFIFIHSESPPPHTYVNI